MHMETAGVDERLDEPVNPIWTTLMAKGFHESTAG